MRKILTISFNSGQKYTGGMQCSQRNRDSLRKIFGSDNTFEYIITPYNIKKTPQVIFNRIIDAFHGFMGGMNSKIQRQLLVLIRDKGITDVFIDSSLLGSFAKQVKLHFPRVSVITFFHNIEIEFIKDSLTVNRDVFHWYWFPSTRYNENCAIKYSDKIIALNKRDSIALKKRYGREADYLIPISFKDKRCIVDDKLKNENKKALFLGSYFFANVEGISWFCEKVLPYVDIELTIVGASMNKLPQSIRNNYKIKVYSDVPDLAPFFNDADFMVLPIFSGSGMKVKTAESLMNGKFILGTKEAFMGYDLTTKCSKECNSAEDFISAIKQLKLQTKYNHASYTTFKEQYSFEATFRIFENIYK